MNHEMIEDVNDSNLDDVNESFEKMMNDVESYIMVDTS